jgi:hypothetical protein
MSSSTSSALSSTPLVVPPLYLRFGKSKAERVGAASAMGG